MFGLDRVCHLCLEGKCCVESRIYSHVRIIFGLDRVLWRQDLKACVLGELAQCCEKDDARQSPDSTDKVVFWGVSVVCRTAWWSRFLIMGISSITQDLN